MHFVSKVPSPAVLQLEEEEKDESFFNQVKEDDKTGKTAILKRGIRTLKEIAHFVRCFNLMPEKRSK
jgi:hypothetical protein